MNLPTGRIVASDPFVSAKTSAFSIQVEPGRYHVILSVAQRETGDERVACAMLRFKPGTVQRWEVAMTTAQNAGLLSEGGEYGYWIDSGHGCFMSHEAARLLRDKMFEREDYWQEMSDALEDSTGSRLCVDWTVSEARNLNAIIFQSGIGDGGYSCYWGYDAAGEILCLVTDFVMLEPEDFDPENEPVSGQTQAGESQDDYEARRDSALRFLAQEA